MDSGERGMNSVAMTIIILGKNIGRAGGSNQQPPALKSTTLSTVLRELGVFIQLSKHLIVHFIFISTNNNNFCTFISSINPD